MGYQRILVGLEQSPLGKTVFDKALAIAKQDGAALKLFHCLPIESSGLNPYATLYNEDIASFSNTLQKKLEAERSVISQWLEDYAHLAQAEGVAVEWDWQLGDPASSIRALAQSWEADLIVIGRKGLSGLAEMFLGSVSNYIVHHVHCSVLVVQDEKANR